MSIFKTYPIDAPEGGTKKVLLSNALNIERRPEAREEILSGTFQQFRLSGESDEHTQVMRSFSYFDPERHTLIFVYPQRQRFQWGKHSEVLEKAYSKFRETGILPKKKSLLRVVYGLNELREKLILQDLGYDDKHVELAKMALLYEHSFLFHKNRLNIYLTGADEKQLYFNANFDHESTVFELVKPKVDFYKFCENSKGLAKWEKRLEQKTLSTNSKNDFWVNVKRWLLDQNALSQLAKYANQLYQGESIDCTSDEFTCMLSHLPTGNHMPPWAKKAIREIYVHIDDSDSIGSTQKTTVLRSLHSLRFRVKLGLGWFGNGIENDDDILWELFEDLPDDHIEGNVNIREIKLINGKYGKYNWDKNVAEVGDGYLRMGTDHQESFEDIVRHEIGHSVHKKYEKEVDRWLRDYCGWQAFVVVDKDGRIHNEAVDKWMKLAGGWSTQSSIEKKQIRDAIVQGMGDKGDFDPGNIQDIPDGHPWLSDTCFARHVYESCIHDGRFWYQNADKWPTVNGISFAFNFFYRSLMVVKTQVLNCFLIKIPGVNPGYATMSPPECFAELYSLYYDSEDDHSMIPIEVTRWLDENIA